MLTASRVSSLNGIRSGIRIIRSLIPASEREVNALPTKRGSASNVRTISLSSAIVADMYIRRGASENVGNSFTNGRTGVIVNEFRLISAWHRCRLSRSSGHTNACFAASVRSCSRTASSCSCQAQYGTSMTPPFEPSTVSSNVPRRSISRKALLKRLVNAS
ncbi:hypothetical protein D9M71_653310 [compost metagenome]